MSLEELCDKAIAEGHNCSVTVSTGPVAADPVWPLWLFGGAVLVALIVMGGFALSEWQTERTKRHDMEVREAGRRLDAR